MSDFVCPIKFTAACTRPAPQGDTFELHLTVTLEPGELSRFRALCQDLGVKPLVIDLGATQPSQTMTCSRVSRDPLETAMALKAQLERAGFAVSRVKLEAAPWNRAVPQVSAEAQTLGQYFEGHGKLLVRSTDLPGLEALCHAHGAHLSRNAFKRREDGLMERFVTLRAAKVGRHEAEARLAGLLEDLRTAGFQVLGSVLEYCIHDSNLELDGAWGAVSA